MKRLLFVLLVGFLLLTGCQKFVTPQKMWTEIEYVKKPNCPIIFDAIDGIPPEKVYLPPMAATIQTKEDAIAIGKNIANYYVQSGDDPYFELWQVTYYQKEDIWHLRFGINKNMVYGGGYDVCLKGDGTLVKAWSGE